MKPNLESEIPPPICFEYQGVGIVFKELNARTWIEAVVKEHGRNIDFLTFIFCSDDYLLGINNTYLNHDYYTDIITFEYLADPLQGDLFISVDRIKENAVTNATTFEEELHRVMIHGVLHILGYDDKTPDLKAAMRNAEEQALSKLIEHQ